MVKAEGRRQEAEGNKAYCTSFLAFFNWLLRACCTGERKKAWGNESADTETRRHGDAENGKSHAKFRSPLLYECGSYAKHGFQAFLCVRSAVEIVSMGSRNLALSWEIPG
ncbi:MAG: hypothetical protein F6K14_19580 [Symploca sp. SIO2C1]|nr:hypothetical protein [Symploca sp. SIO2C1]